MENENGLFSDKNTITILPAGYDFLT